MQTKLSCIELTDIVNDTITSVANFPYAPMTAAAIAQQMPHMFFIEKNSLGVDRLCVARIDGEPLQITAVNGVLPYTPTITDYDTLVRNNTLFHGHPIHRPKRDKTCLFLAIVTGVIGAACYVIKMASFEWGDVQMMANGATFNDIWYYLFESLSYASSMAALAFAASHVAKRETHSYSAFLLKYLTIASAFIFSVRAVFNIFYYDCVTELEALVDFALVAHTFYRASLWYKSNLRKHHAVTSGNLAGNHP